MEGSAVNHRAAVNFRRSRQTISLASFLIQLFHCCTSLLISCPYRRVSDSFFAHSPAPRHVTKTINLLCHLVEKILIKSCNFYVSQKLENISRDWRSSSITTSKHVSFHADVSPGKFHLTTLTHKTTLSRFFYISLMVAEYKLEDELKHLLQFKVGFKIGQGAAHLSLAWDRQNASLIDTIEGEEI